MSQSLALDDTMGAALIGVIVAAALWGVLCVQMWFYYNNYPRDHWYIKLFVATVWFSDTLHQILIAHTVYTYLVTNFGNLVELDKIIWSIMAMVLVNGVTAFMVQSFMTLRVWKLTNGNYVLTGMVSTLVLGEFIAILYYCGTAFQLKTFTQLPAVRGASMSVNILAAAGDALIALVLCFMLHRSRTGFRRSDTMIKRLIIFTINTGLLTSLCAIASLISIIASPNTFIYIAFFFNLGRLYSNTLMATLNARHSIRSALDDNSMTVSLSRLKQGASSTVNSQRPAQNIAIKVDTIQEYAGERQYSDREFLDMGDSKIDRAGGEAVTSGWIRASYKQNLAVFSMTFNIWAR